MVVIGGASPPWSESAFEQVSCGDGGDRWVGHTGVAGHGRVTTGDGPLASVDPATAARWW